MLVRYIVFFSAQKPLSNCTVPPEPQKYCNSNSQLPTPNSQLPTPNSQFPKIRNLCTSPRLRTAIIATGEKAKRVDELYGSNNLINLKKLQREQKFRKAGININELDMNYIVNQKDFEELGKFLSLYHCVFAGLVVDEYFFN